MVEPQPSKLMTWVRFPLPAPNKKDLINTEKSAYEVFYFTKKYAIGMK